MAQVTDLETISDKEAPMSIPARPGSQPVLDMDAFLASLPKFTDREVQVLEEAIANDRAQRRSYLETEH